MPDGPLLHPDEGELLRYADGELSRWRRLRLRRHLAACWQCRAALAELERTIGECVRYRREVLARCLPEPPEPWFDLRRRIEQWEADRAEVSRARRLWARLAPGALTPQRLAVAGVLAALVWAQATLILRNREAPRPAPLETAPAPAPLAGLPSRAEPPPAASARPKATVAGPSAAPVEMATAGDELRVFALLRRLGADLGEPVEVSRQGGRVVVAGAGVSPEVERRLAAELGTAPRITLRFAAPASEVPPPAARGVVTAELRPEAARLLAGLEQRLGGRANAEQALGELLETNDTLLAHLHALRRLAERFPPEVEAQLDVSERRLLAGLLAEHGAEAAALGASLEARARTLLAPASLTAGESLPAVAVSWQEAAAGLLRLARHAESRLATMLEGAAQEESPEALVREWLAELARLRVETEAFRRRFAE
jgi:hypothetical protein